MQVRYIVTLLSVHCLMIQQLSAMEVKVATKADITTQELDALCKLIDDKIKNK